MRGQDINLPEGRLGQLLAVAALLIVAATVWFAAIIPALSWYGGRSDDLQTARLELAHMQALRRSLPALRQEVAQNSTLSAGTDILLTGDSDAIAGANLQSALNDLAVQAGTSLDSAETIAVQKNGGLRQIGLAVSVTATWPTLIAYLTAIDSARPRMMVDDLTVITNSSPDARQDVTLQVNFTASAFRAGSAP